MKALFLFTIVVLAFIGAIFYWGILPYTPWGHKENSFAHMISSLNLRQTLLHIKPAKDYSNDPREKLRLEVLKDYQLNGGGAPMTAEEQKIVNYKEYDEADRLPDFAYFLTFALIGSGFSAIFFGNQVSIKISFILCIILLFFSWELIAVALFIDVVIIPTLLCMGIKGLFSK